MSRQIQLIHADQTERARQLVQTYGIGRISKNMQDAEGAAKRILLDNLPKLLKGYGNTFTAYHDYTAAVILVCDLDDKCQKTFRSELYTGTLV